MNTDEPQYGWLPKRCTCGYRLVRVGLIADARYRNDGSLPSALNVGECVSCHLLYRLREAGPSDD